MLKKCCQCVTLAAHSFSLNCQKTDSCNSLNATLSYCCPGPRPQQGRQPPAHSTATRLRLAGLEVGNGGLTLRLGAFAVQHDRPVALLDQSAVERNITPAGGAAAGLSGPPSNRTM